MDAQKLLAQVTVAGLDALILDRDDPRWVRLAFHPASSLDLRDRFRGALVGGAIGDAMGRPNEGVPADVARERRIRDYQAWGGWRGGPKGTIADDTQMTMWLVESILATAGKMREAGPIEARDRLLDPHDIAERFTRERIRGIGQATREFVHEYKAL
jgi:ADP-ribosylglycohydrolase